MSNNFFNGSQNLSCLFARNSQKTKNLSSLFFFLANNVARVTEVKTDLILFKFSVLFDSEEVQEGNI